MLMLEGQQCFNECSFDDTLSFTTSYRSFVEQEIFHVAKQ